jgi:GTPase SAR1 family protein
LIVLFIALCWHRSGRAKRAHRRERVAQLPKLQSIADVVRKMPDDLVLHSMRGGVNITLHTWDFAGQSVYYDTHHLFVTRGVYLLVFDLEDARKGVAACLESLSFWLNSLETQIEDPEDFSVILVGTHADVVSKHADHTVISRELKAALGGSAAWQRLAQPPQLLDEQLCFYSVDNTQPRGSAMLHAEIQRLAEDIVNRKPEYPIEWLSLMDLLQTQANGGVSYMPVFEEDGVEISVQTMVQLAGIAAERTMEFCEVCDDLGVFRLFKNSKDRRPMLILRLQWLLDVFSSVITQRHLLEQRCSDVCSPDEWHRFVSEAVVSRGVLDRLWADLPDDTELLVLVMQQFDLMFEIRGGGADTASFHVPGMLTASEDAAPSTVERRDCLAQCILVVCRKDCDEPFAEQSRKLPAGLFPRLQAQAARWNQATSDVPPDLSRAQAAFTFGSQRFELHVDFRKRAIYWTADESCNFPLGMVTSVKRMLDNILAQVYPLLRCSIGVRSAPDAAWVDLLRAQEAIESLPRGRTVFILDGAEHRPSSFSQWCAQSSDDDDVSSGFDVFLSFRDEDEAFAGKLADCIGSQAKDDGTCVRVCQGSSAADRIGALARSRIFMVGRHVHERAPHLRAHLI